LLGPGVSFPHGPVFEFYCRAEPTSHTFRTERLVITASVVALVLAWRSTRSLLVKDALVPKTKSLKDLNPTSPPVSWLSGNFLDLDGHVPFPDPRVPPPPFRDTTGTVEIFCFLLCGVGGEVHAHRNVLG